MDVFFELRDRRLRGRWVGPSSAAADRPVLVFLHEGLGCIEMWRNFPTALCDTLACRGLVYDRTGYGRSSRWPAPPGGAYMDIEADQVLPALLAAAAIDDVILVGHSDGGTIALSYAGNDPEPLRGLVTLAAHVITEPVGVESIRAARRAYDGGELRTRLARYHDDVDGAFSLWSEAWLTPGFEPMDADRRLPGVQVPVQAIQGEDDLYSSELQLGLIAGKVSGYSETRLIAACGHSPHLDQPAQTLAEATRFIVPLLMTD
jgi:pimeloyl-ACP methyl ester carboxylesterase